MLYHIGLHACVKLYHCYDICLIKIRIATDPQLSGSVGVTFVDPLCIGPIQHQAFLHVDSLVASKEIGYRVVLSLLQTVSF